MFISRGEEGWNKQEKSVEDDEEKDLRLSSIFFGVRRLKFSGRSNLSETERVPKAILGKRFMIKQQTAQCAISGRNQSIWMQM